MPYAIGFDVYGTLVDPMQMKQPLRDLVGDRADRFLELWREKQVEYAFRRGLMKKYENFGVCTKQALEFTTASLGVHLSHEAHKELIKHYQQLPAFPDVVQGIMKLKAAGNTVVAFSNGTEAAVRSLLEQAGVLEHLEAVVSVDDLKTFKPDPEVYQYLAKRLNRAQSETWLVSSNPWDVIGAKSAGLKAAWIKRKPDAAFDPWEIEADCVVTDMNALADWFQGG